MLPFLLTACLPGPIPPADIPELAELEPPFIETLSMECDVDRERWRLEVETAWWTGGGRLLMTADGEYIEQHAVRSIRAAGDGTSDLLRLDLGFVADFRDVSPGSTTAFTCATQPSALFVLLDPDGDTERECQLWGPNIAIWDDVPDTTELTCSAALPDEG